MPNVIFTSLILLVSLASTQVRCHQLQASVVAVVDGPQLAFAEIDVELQCYLQNSTAHIDRTMWWKDGELIFTYFRNGKKPFEDARASIVGRKSSLIVDEVLSDSNRLHLKYVTAKTASGKYQCGLYADGAMSISKPHVLTIKEVFDHLPRMIGFPTTAHVNDTISGTCSVRIKAKYSHLAQTTLITFAVNGIPIQPSDQISLKNTVTQRQGRTVVTETLNMTLDPTSFTNLPARRRQVRLTCIGTVKNYGNYPHVSTIIYDANHSVATDFSHPGNEADFGVDPALDEIDVRNQDSTATHVSESEEVNPIDYVEKIYHELQAHTRILLDRRDIEKKSFALAKEEFEWAKNVTPHAN